ncbi:MAG: hypothetical protein LBR47_01665 [Spirochaetaceae bacterium]|nr:hypothetical protein [Spirochaetaceae bacterium]
MAGFEFLYRGLQGKISQRNKKNNSQKIDNSADEMYCAKSVLDTQANQKQSYQNKYFYPFIPYKKLLLEKKSAGECKKKQRQNYLAPEQADNGIYQKQSGMNPVIHWIENNKIEKSER